ncbi:Bodo-specific multi-copy gene family, putative [Bodo saltans]|uniref:Bodo-specific multi-copy gene family, putative n=1 Tax=Bodo saltans TaxID=75058 RepID=A0A0S4IK69_BODSA|nr:Bodo-specific multi-copy gene family, putative [Bodo saltans]|eukprot:CUE63735.1 Bodo-specific multi-copy gene family, putative [Bodo saltans]
MKRARVFPDSRVTFPTHYVSKCGIATTTLPLLLQRGQRGRTPPQYYNPHTWPKHWTATDIKSALDGNLVNPGDLPNYESLAMMLNIDLNALCILIRGCVKPPQIKEVDLESYLREHVDPKTENAEMPLQERELLLEHVNKGLARKDGSEKREVVLSYSPRGSGKTQFLKWFVHQKRSEAMKCGRVIVRCCGVTTRGKPQPLWLTKVLQVSKKNKNQQPQGSSDDGLCELIREHVESITGYLQDPSHYTTPDEAYATWKRETAWWFGIPPSKENVDPLIILDTCELLAEHEHKSLVHPPSETAEATPFTLLEAFCLAMPSPHSIVFIGSSAKFDERFSLTLANVTNIGLPPLTQDGHRSAITESWKTSMEESMRIPMYHLAGGMPSLLRLAEQHSTLGEFSDCFEAFQTAARSERIAAHDKWFPHAYTCLLASSTKAKVLGSDPIVVNPSWRDPMENLKMTYDEAMINSIGSYDKVTSRIMVPPIAFDDAAVTRPDAPILPSQLHPFLYSGAAQHFGKNSPLERSQQFDKPFLFAVYARYLLALWKGTSGGPWVPLAKVFEGALQPEQQAVMERYEVNLSRGVNIVKNSPAPKHAVTFTGTYEDAAKNAVTYLGGNAHHDAYIWCREAPLNATGERVQAKMPKEQTKSTFAIPLLLRHETRKALSHLEPQRRQSKAASKQVTLLLLVNQKPCDVCKDHVNDIVMINAAAMSNTSWLW